MSLICIRIRNSFPFEWLCTRTRFETEACNNSEMGYSILEDHFCFFPLAGSSEIMPDRCVVPDEEEGQNIT